MSVRNQHSDDIRFLMVNNRKSCRAAFARARVPDVLEIRELFLAAQPKVLKLAANI